MIDNCVIDLTTVDHTAVVDALLRFGAGTDAGDTRLLTSAFTDDAIVDFEACGRTIGLDCEPLEGAKAAVDFLAGTCRLQATSHVITSPRVRSTDVGAHLRALVDATHVVREDPARRFRMMNWYDADLAGSGDQWRISELSISNVWFEGDPTVLFVR